MLQDNDDDEGNADVVKDTVNVSSSRHATKVKEKLCKVKEVSLKKLEKEIEKLKLERMSESCGNEEDYIMCENEPCCG